MPIESRSTASQAIPEYVRVSDGVDRAFPIPSLKMDPQIRSLLLQDGYTLTHAEPREVMFFPGGGQWAGSSEQFVYDWRSADPLIITVGRNDSPEIIRIYTELDGPLRWTMGNDPVPREILQHHLTTLARAVAICNAPRSMPGYPFTDSEMQQRYIDRMLKAYPARYRTVPVAMLSNAANRLFYLPDSQAVIDQKETSLKKYTHTDGKERFAMRWREAAVKP